jgi:ATP-dependent Clp protease adapter protein ClpS
MWLLHCLVILMSIFKLLNRYMERNQAASQALLRPLDRLSIQGFDGLSESLWLSIKSCADGSHLIQLVNDQVVPYEFIVSLLMKLGFDCESSVRLMMDFHRFGIIDVAIADYELLVDLKTYIENQAQQQDLHVLVKILQVE